LLLVLIAALFAISRGAVKKSIRKQWEYTVTGNIKSIHPRIIKIAVKRKSILN